MIDFLKSLFRYRPVKPVRDFYVADFRPTADITTHELAVLWSKLTTCESPPYLSGRIYVPVGEWTNTVTELKGADRHLVVTDIVALDACFVEVPRQ